MCDKKALPRPSPVEAPLTRPAMSVTLRKAGTLLKIEKNKIKKRKPEEAIFASRI